MKELVFRQYIENFIIQMGATKPTLASKDLSAKSVRKKISHIGWEFMVYWKGLDL